jgi:SAM-dependent methyltransferase
MSTQDEFYDREGVLDRYRRHRDRQDNPNDAIERPIFLELLGNVRGLDIVDLGCGDAGFGREALEQAARSYHGVEVSRAMVDLARRSLDAERGSVELVSIERWQPRPGEADLVTSRLALNYVEDLSDVFRKAQLALTPSGRFVFSVEHPVITSSFESLAGGVRTSWLVDNYFLTGARRHEWLGQEVTKYHRTIEDYLVLLRENGFGLERLRESRPSPENFENHEEYLRRLRIPLFLFVSARKLEPAA